jgi:hypothetical protein
MRSGDANGSLGVSAIFQSKLLNNDAPPSASSRLVRTADEQFGASARGSFAHCKIFIAQITAPIQVAAMQRTDGRGPDGIRLLNFERRVDGWRFTETPYNYWPK